MIPSTGAVQPTIDPLRRHFVSVSGRADAARTLLFSHGFGTDQRAWDAVAAAFEAEWRIVRFDHAGAGRSAPGSFVQHRYLGLDGYVEDLVAICDALALRGAVLVGHSVGAMIGLLASIARPRSFSKLVLVGASPRYLDDDGYRGGFTRPDLDALYGSVMHSYPAWAEAFAPLAMGNPERPSLARQFAESLKAIPPSQALTVLGSIFQSDHRADLRRVTHPTLILQSRDDVAVPLAVAEYLHRAIPGSQLVVMEASGHFPHLSAPKAVIAPLRAFI